MSWVDHHGSPAEKKNDDDDDDDDDADDSEDNSSSSSSNNNNNNKRQAAKTAGTTATTVMAADGSVAVAVSDLDSAVHFFPKNNDQDLIRQRPTSSTTSYNVTNQSNDIELLSRCVSTGHRLCLFDTDTHTTEQRVNEIKVNYLFSSLIRGV